MDGMGTMFGATVPTHRGCLQTPLAHHFHGNLCGFAANLDGVALGVGLGEVLDLDF